MKPPMTMWESKTFIRQADELMSVEENSALKFYLGLQPESGDSQKEKAELHTVIKSIRHEYRKRDE